MTTSPRTTPDGVSDPGGFSGSTLATRVRASVEFLASSVINQIDKTTIGGTANAVTAACKVPLIGGYQDGQTFRWTPGANNTTAVTVNFDSKGAGDWRQPDGTALVSGDIVSGVPEEGWYDQVAGYFRKSTFSQRYISAAALASISTNILWALLGDTTVGGAVAQVEHTFTAGAYSRIVMVLSSLKSANNGVNAVVTLRKASGAIVTLTTTGMVVDGGSGNFQNSDYQTIKVDFVLGLVAGSLAHYGSLIGASRDQAGGVFLKVDPITGIGADASAPDRVRINYSAGNIAAGRVMTYGLVA